MQREKCEQRPRTRAPQFERFACLPCFKRTQKGQLEHATTSRGHFR